MARVHLHELIRAQLDAADRRRAAEQVRPLPADAVHGREVADRPTAPGPHEGVRSEHRVMQGRREQVRQPFTRPSPGQEHVRDGAAGAVVVEIAEDRRDDRHDATATPRRELALETRGALLVGSLRAQRLRNDAPFERVERGGVDQEAPELQATAAPGGARARRALPGPRARRRPTGSRGNGRRLSRAAPPRPRATPAAPRRVRRAWRAERTPLCPAPAPRGGRPRRAPPPATAWTSPASATSTPSVGPERGLVKRPANLKRPRRSPALSGRRRAAAPSGPRSEPRAERRPSCPSRRRATPSAPREAP